MGFFDGKIRTRVATTVSRVIEDKLIPNSVKSAVIESLYGDTDLLETLQDNLTKTIAVKAEKVYDYSEKNYIFGNPTGEIVSSVIVRTEVETILKTSLGNPNINVVYVKYGPANLTHIAWLKLVNDYGYKTKTNEITKLPKGASKSFPKLVNMILNVPFFLMQNGTYTEDSLKVWEYSAKYRGQFLNDSGRPISNQLFQELPEWSYTATKASAIIHSSLLEETVIAGRFMIEREVPLDELVIDLSGYDMEADYFHVKYNIGDQEYFWMYKMGSGTYLDLDTYFEKPNRNKTMGSFYPFIYFRTNKRSMAADKNSPEYKSSKKIVDYLGMDFDLITKEIHKNPGIDDVEQAMMVMGVPALSTDPLELKYLFSFFDSLYQFQDNQYRYPSELMYSSDDFNGLRSNEDLKNAFWIQDKKFSMVLNNKGIFKKIRAGSIGSRGTCTVEFEYIEVDVKGTDNYGHLDIYKAYIPKFVYRKQTGIATYEEIEVIDLRLSYHIFEDLWTTGIGKEPSLLVPIDKTILDTFSAKDREYLCARSLHYVFNSRIEQKVSWYQSGAFQFVITAIAVVVGAYLSIPYLVAQNLAAATFMQALIFIRGLIIKAIVSSFILKKVVEVIGIKNSVTLAAILVIASFVSPAANSTFIGNLSQVALGLLKKAGESIQEALKLLGEESTDFMKEIKNQMKLLEDVNDLLRPSLVMQPYIFLGEKPENYYNRTVHAGNVGALAVTAHLSELERMTRLPTIEDTLGGFNDKSF